MSAMNQAVPPVAEIPRIPIDANQDIVFNFPWEAKAFALVVHLFQAGHYTWAEWTEALSAEIKAAGAEDDGSKYYLLWLAAAEKLVARKALAGAGELRGRKVALEMAQGGPVEPEPGEKKKDKKKHGH